MGDSGEEKEREWGIVGKKGREWGIVGKKGREWGKWGRKGESDMHESLTSLKHLSMVRSLKLPG